MFTSILLIYYSFIIYRPAPHLDRKHTIFGKVVGGLDVLDRMETTPVDSLDRPKNDIKINQVIVYVDPFEEFQKQQKQKEEEEKAEEARKKEETDDQKTTWTGKRLRNDKSNTTSGGGLVGKYLKEAISSHTIKGTHSKDDEVLETVEDEPFYEEPRKKVKSKGGFGNFDGW